MRDTLIHNGAKGLTSQQVAWAKQHDWFAYEALDCLGIVVYDYSQAADGTWHDDVATFHDFSALKAWAGY